jgi:hypothetical protein
MNAPLQTSDDVANHQMRLKILEGMGRIKELDTILLEKTEVRMRQACGLCIALDFCFRTLTPLQK